jgi:serine/threonine-protein kinase
VRSIAVLPFANASGDDGVQYLCDGIAESLTNWLATVPDVRVVSKTAAFRFRDDAGDIATVAKALGVESVVSGRLETVNGSVVVSAALVDARDDTQLWGERLVQPLSDVIYLERSIVDAIKESLGLTIAATPEVAASGSTDNPEAYNHYLRGHYLVQTWDAASIREGIDELRAAIALDPKYGLPYADIADAVSQMIFYGIFNTDDALIGEARSAAYSAVALAPDAPESHTAMATMHQYLTFDWAAAEAAYEKAIALPSPNPTAFHRYADFMWATLRFDRARQMAGRALEVDPRDGNSMHAAGIAAMFDGDYAEAARKFGDWNRFYPGSRWSYTKHAVALALSGDCETALTQAAAGDEFSGHNPGVLMESWHAWVYRLCDREDLFQRSKARIEAVRAERPPGIRSALLYMYMLEGQEDALRDLVRETVDTKSPLTMFLQIPMLDIPGWAVDAIRDDPAYREIIREQNFPPSPWSVE